MMAAATGGDVGAAVATAAVATCCVIGVGVGGGLIIKPLRRSGELFAMMACTNDSGTNCLNLLDKT
jgi:hypothetical protein